MVSDGLSIMNADYSSTSFRCRQVAIGARQLPGQQHRLPRRGPDRRQLPARARRSWSRSTARCGRTSGLLGSPPFEIPRTVAARQRLRRPQTRGRAAPRGCAARTGTTLVTMVLFLLVRWFAGLRVAGHRHRSPSTCTTPFGALGVAARSSRPLLFTHRCYSVLVERLCTGFRRLQPRFCSIYDPYFWRHERLWKVLGRRRTPVSTAPRSRPWSGGCWASGSAGGSSTTAAAIPRRRWSTIGDDCMLNAGSVIQCHSLEDGTFKSDHTAIGAGCTIGVGASCTTA